MLTDYIMERYDSLPRVEEGFREDLPMVEITEVTEVSNSETRIRFSSSGNKTIVIMNDEIVGVTEQNEITIKDLDNGIENQIVLVPITENLRGEGESVVIGQKAEKTSFLIPKVPNTGKR